MEWHASPGWHLADEGAPFRAGATLSQAHITDVAPTLLYLLGLPVPAEMDGKVMIEAFHEEFVSLHPVLYQENELLTHATRPSEAVYTMLETAKIQARLKDLGLHRLTEGEMRGNRWQKL